MTQVSFHYNENTKKWTPLVTGVENENEARQAFNAVVFSCHGLDEELFEYHKVIKHHPTVWKRANPIDPVYEIHPAL